MFTATQPSLGLHGQMQLWCLALVTFVQGSLLHPRPAPPRDYAIYNRVLASLPEAANRDSFLMISRTVTREASFRRTVLRVMPGEHQDTALVDSLASGAEAFTPHTLDTVALRGGPRLITDSAFRSEFRGNPREGWAAFRARYPGVYAVIEFSNIVYDPTGALAVVYVAVKCGSLCGRGQLYYLARRDDEWSIIRVETEWVS